MYGDKLSGTSKTFAQIFIILGLLIFAKEVPKMLSNLFGIDEAGLGSLNPLKKLGGVAGAGFLGGVTGVGMKGVAGGIGAVSGAVSSFKNKGSIWAGIKQGAGAGAKGISLKGGLGNIHKQFGGVVKSWHRGAGAGASGATGVDNTPVGFGAFMANRAKATVDQQTLARDRASAGALKNARNKILENRTRNGVTDDSMDFKIFKHENFRNRFKDFNDDNKIATKAQNNFDTVQSKYNSDMMNQDSQAYKLNNALQNAKIGGDATAIGEAQAAFDNEMKYYIDAKKALRDANDKLEVSKGNFEAEKKLNRNADDVALLDRRAQLKNSGRV
jgi:hypothetical protein